MNTVSIGEGFGRVNLIGEHLDYNGGHVLPLQIKNSIICEIVENKNSESISIVSDKYKDSFNARIKVCLEFKQVFTFKDIRQ